MSRTEMAFVVSRRKYRNDFHLNFNPELLDVERFFLLIIVYAEYLTFKTIMKYYKYDIYNL